MGFKIISLLGLIILYLMYFMVLSFGDSREWCIFFNLKIIDLVVILSMYFGMLNIIK